jgi:predicted RNA binding protein YcfA (HicA-like mRNA interferase family)
VSRKSKLLAKLANHDADSTWTVADAEWLLAQHGYVGRIGKGSHRAFVAPNRARPIVLAMHGKWLKSGYIRMLRDELLNS